MSLSSFFADRVRVFEPLAGRTSFQIGGEARYWYEPADENELCDFLRAKKHDCARRLAPFFVIGCGSNLLISDGLVAKTFIHLGSPAFGKIEIDGQIVRVGAGARIARLLSVLAASDLGGYEFLAGIPGSIGGALAGNAGTKVEAFGPPQNVEACGPPQNVEACGPPQNVEAFGPRGFFEMGDIVLDVEVLDAQGERMTLKKEDIRFSYRTSSLRPFIILSARLKLFEADKTAVAGRLSALLLGRRLSQDWQYPSAGSFFKNPQGPLAAGRLIDSCALKGRRVGGAQVSPKHANFIINTGAATFADVATLADIVRQKVYETYHIQLVPEVEIVSCP